MKRPSSFLLVSAVVALSGGCSPYTDPFLTVQACIGDDRVFVRDFSSIFADVIGTHGLTVNDDSAEIEERSYGMNSIFIEVERRDKTKVFLTNGGLPRDQVVVGFFGDADADRKAADDFIEIMKRRWRVETVPAGKGAIALTDCYSST